MTTKELIDWAMKAEHIHEKSWNEKTGKYALTLSQSAKAVILPNALPVEEDLVVCLLHTCWNEIQDWHSFWH